MKFVRKIFGFVILFLSLVYINVNQVEAANEEDYAPGTYATINDIGEQNLIMRDILISNSVSETYWSSQFGTVNGHGGYGGFQQISGTDSSGTQKLLFSLWDRDYSKAAIEHVPEGFTGYDFGGEGTGVSIQGLHSFEIGRWYSIAQKVWFEDGNTKYGQWIKDTTTKEWFPMGVLVAQNHNGGAFNYSVLFTEPFGGSDTERIALRKVKLKNIYGKNDIGWSSLKSHKVLGSFSAEKNWNAGISGENREELWLQSGGGEDPTVKNNQVLTINQDATPSLDPITVFETSVDNSEGYTIFWTLDETSSPLFTTKIDILDEDDTIVATKNENSYTTKTTFEKEDLPSSAKTVRLTITDIFDQVKEISFPYSNKQSIHAEDFKMIIGNAQPTLDDFKAEATDSNGDKQNINADFSKVDFKTPGTYKVTLTTDDNQKKTVNLTVQYAKQWGTVGWDFDSTSGVLTLLNSGTLGESADSPWNRTDENKIDSSLIKKIVFSKPVYAPKNSTSLFARLGKIEQFDNMSNLDTSLVTNMNDMFAYESAITKLNLSTFDTINVRNFQGMFFGSDHIESLDLSNFDTNNVINFPYMFSSLDKLKELTLGEKAIFDNQSIGGSASHEWVNVSNPSITMGTNQTFFKNYKDYTGEKEGKYVWKSNVENYKKVVFATDGGTTIKDQWVLTGEVISASSPSKENYSFDGWFKDKEVNVPFDFSVPINEDTTIYAKWTKDQRSFVASDYTMYIGDKTLTVADFKASATDKTGSAVDVSVDFGNNDITKAGEYNVTLKSSDGQTKTVKLTVKENKQSITGSDYSMYVGDKTPTASDFKASATDKDGEAVDVTADFGGNDITKAGEHEVTLRSSDDQAIKVKLTVLVKDDQITVMYRTYNPNNGEHFYTQSIQEKNVLLTAGWKDEGIGWYAPMSGDPVYRVYNPNVGDHHYTLSNDEKTYLVSQGWKDEGIGWFSGGDIPLYRQYNPNAKTGSHNFTTSINEKDSLIKVGWRDEGISWYSIR